MKDPFLPITSTLSPFHQKVQSEQTASCCIVVDNLIKMRNIYGILTPTRATNSCMTFDESKKHTSRAVQIHYLNNFTKGSYSRKGSFGRPEPYRTGCFANPSSTKKHEPVVPPLPPPCALSARFFFHTSPRLPRLRIAQYNRHNWASDRVDRNSREREKSKKWNFAHQVMYSINRRLFTKNKLL